MPQARPLVIVKPHWDSCSLSIFPQRSPYHEGARLPTTASCMLLSTSTRPRTNSAPGKSGIERNNGGKRGSSAVRRWLSACSSHSRLRSSSLSLNEKNFTACLGESPDALTASASTVAWRSSLCAISSIASPYNDPMFISRNHISVDVILFPAISSLSNLCDWSLMLSIDRGFV